MPDSMDHLQRELLKTFQVEAQEHLQKLNETLLRLERLPEETARQPLLFEAFRSAHSLKGAARAVSVVEIETLAHIMESVLQLARDAQLELKPDVCDVLYDALDTIQHLLNGDPVDIVPMRDRLAMVAASTEGLPEGVPETVPVQEMPVIQSDDTIRVDVSKLDDLMAQASELAMAEISAEQSLADVRALRDQITRWPKLWREIKVLLPRLEGAAGQRLIDLLTRHHEYMQTLSRKVNALEQNASRDSLNLNMSVTRLQDEVRRVRMVPFQTLVPGLQRAVRDAARSESKQVVFSIEGSEVELDKKVLEALKDPLLHLLRNAVIHGIEPPEVRTAAGKFAEGQVVLAVRQQGSEVHIAVRDDGRGFDVEALRRRSQEHNALVFDDDADPDDIIAALAFQPGLTTMQQVTEMAGRGMGLDVVRQNIAQFQGRIRIQNTPGQGASIELIVPVSLIMSRGLLVQVGSERYVLPLIAVEKIMELQDTCTIGGQPAVQVNDRPVPLVSLAALLERPLYKNGNGNKPLAVIISVAEQRLAVLIDDVLTEQELAVKPLVMPLRHVRNVEGTALLNTGEPVVVLNAGDLLKSARNLSGAVLPTADTQANVVKSSAHILVVDDSITTRTLEKNILEAAGYRVTTAIDGIQALQKLEGGTIDLVVTDIQMPNLDGFALTRQLRETPKHSTLPIILVTSLESREDRERGMLAGADAYFVKRGFNQAELLATIERLL